MTLKKNLRYYKEKSGQAVLEYFLVFIFIAMLTILSLSAFFPKVQNAILGPGGIFVKSARAISGVN